MPIIPTDSLYKFLFVGGIVLVIAAQFSMIEARKNNIEEDIRYFNQLRDFMPKVLAEEKIIDSIQDLNKIGRSKNINKLTVKDSGNNLFDRKLKLLKYVTEINTYELSSYKTNYSAVVENRIFLLWLIDIMSSTGFALIIIGVWNWNKYLQKPQDRLLQIQLALAELELKNKIEPKPSNE